MSLLLGGAGRPGPPSISARNSCPELALSKFFEHGMRHLNADLDHLPKVETSVHAALKERFSGKPIDAAAGQAQVLPEQGMHAGWMPYIKNTMGKVERLHAAIDSAQEHVRLSKICAGEVQSLIGPPKRNRR